MRKLLLLLLIIQSMNLDRGCCGDPGTHCHIDRQAASWKALLPEGVSNDSDNPVAPPSYTWGPEGKSWHAAWHENFGGSEEKGWRAATEWRQAAEKDSSVLKDRIEGMLIGSAIGDAAGGPVEFVDPPHRSFWSITDRRLTREGIEELGGLFRLRDYPKPWEPFAQWESYGPAGTITDDTRFKMIFFHALKSCTGELTKECFARSVFDFREDLPSEYHEQYDAWIPEIAFATRWALGEREGAYPVERIWGGIPTMEGQMPFLPVAALGPYDPEWCYLKTYELGYFDIGMAKDMNSALVAGLAAALQPGGNWTTFEEAMRKTDPYRYSEVLYVDRQLLKWLDAAHRWVDESEGNIACLFRLMEEQLQATYWWESWVPIAVVMACAGIVEYDPLAAMQLMIEFGHDTDSYAQVMGAVLGAIHGKEVWPPEMRKMVNDRMKEQFGQNVDDWMKWIDLYQR